MLTDELNFRMTELEESLAAPDGASTHAETLAALLAAGEQISKQIAMGLTPEEYEQAQKVYQGLAAAHEIISLFPVPKLD